MSDQRTHDEHRMPGGDQEASLHSSGRMSRRRLLGTAGAGMAVAGVGAVLAPRTAYADPVDIPATWDREVDVVIVGGGGAGTCTAIEAARAGMDVLVLEKAEEIGGNTTHSGGMAYLGGGTEIQKANGFEDTPENMLSYLNEQMGPTADQDRNRIYAEGSVEHFEWLRNEGVPFGEKFFPGKVVIAPADEGGLSFSGNEANYPFDEIAEPMPRGHTAKGGGAGFYAPLKAALEQTGATIEVNVSASRLVTAPGGRVVGVVAQVGGQDRYILARNGVVLTSGGFQFNEEMLAIHAPWYLGMDPLGGPHQGDDGSGIRMAELVGAATINMAFASPWKFVYSPGEMCQGVLIDGRGMRFVNESAYGQDVGDALAKKTDGVGWLIMDQDVVAAVEAAGRALGEPDASAETLDELAALLDLPTELFANTMAFYNEQAARGEDPIFHKHAEFLTPLQNPPFVAFDWGATTGVGFITLGGLRADGECRVLDAFGAPIPGLYGAGRTAPGISREVYNSGTAVGDCTFWGRVAGRTVAAGESWSG